MLSEEYRSRLKEIKAKYPDTRSAVMPALYLAQEALGSVTDEAISWVAKELALPPAHVLEVATFYTMYYKKPVGRYHIQVCRTLSCMVCGARQITAYIKERFKIAAGQITADGMWSYEEVECLGSCGTAPMLQINDVFFENLTTEKFAQLLDRIEREQPDLRYSTLRAELGNGLVGCPKSEIAEALK
ncbi:NADH-quinone oxidoreductase subunit NuoE [bacterium]|nr:NADH-quinone oxidoreductase subunit NuoE [bacterium]